MKSVLSTGLRNKGIWAPGAIPLAFTKCWNKPLGEICGHNMMIFFYLLDSTLMLSISITELPFVFMPRFKLNKFLILSLQNLN